jgi:hypothetical protein
LIDMGANAPTSPKVQALDRLDRRKIMGVMQMILQFSAISISTNVSPMNELKAIEKDSMSFQITQQWPKWVPGRIVLRLPSEPKWDIESPMSLHVSRERSDGRPEHTPRGKGQGGIVFAHQSDKSGGMAQECGCMLCVAQEGTCEVSVETPRSGCDFQLPTHPSLKVGK